MKNKYLFPADILLPKFSPTDKEAYQKYSVIACDQYTSDEGYWRRVAKTTADSLSTLDMILPEVYLSGDYTARIEQINEKMAACLSDSLQLHPGSMIYVERTLPSNGRIRRGIVAAVDLEDYDFTGKIPSPIRSTEGTVLERIPPRVKIRENAALELPHVMLFADDPEDLLFSGLAQIKDSFTVAYDFDLMENGGHICGRFPDAAGMRHVDEAVCALSDPERFNKKYGLTGAAPLVFAVGDGNHSLATAKTCYENIKKAMGEEAAKASPARYALVEIVNIHDPAVEFEAIYRVLFGCDIRHLKASLSAYFDDLSFDTPTAEKYHTYEYYSKEECGKFYINSPEAYLPVGELQRFLDQYVKENSGVTVDYIHGENVLKALAEKPDTVGFIFSGMQKSELFPSVISDGALPRKTFSMGEADDKRFYLEARKIR